MLNAVAGVLFIVLSTVASAGAAPSEPVPVPLGRTPLCDGHIEAGEWSDAREWTFANDDRLLIKRDRDYLYVAVQPATPELYGINLYVDRGAPKQLNLHASAKLGEREGSGDAWPEWVWWNNEGWTANGPRIDTVNPLKFLRDDAKEFQIALAKLHAADLRMSVEVESRKGAQTFAPADAEPGRHWIRLALPR